MPSIIVIVASAKHDFPMEAFAENENGLISITYSRDQWEEKIRSRISRPFAGPIIKLNTKA